MRGPRAKVFQGIMQDSEVGKQCHEVEGCIGNLRLPSPGILLFTRPVTMFEALHTEAGEKLPFLEATAAGEKAGRTDTPAVLGRQSH